MSCRFIGLFFLFLLKQLYSQNFIDQLYWKPDRNKKRDVSKSKIIPTVTTVYIVIWSLVNKIIAGYSNIS